MSRKGEKEEAKCGANHPTSLRYAVAGREKKIIVDRRAKNEDRGEKNKPRKTRKARK